MLTAEDILCPPRRMVKKIYCPLLFWNRITEVLLLAQLSAVWTDRVAEAGVAMQ